MEQKFHNEFKGDDRLNAEQKAYERDQRFDQDVLHRKAKESIDKLQESIDQQQESLPQKRTGGSGWCSRR